jgi:hypothetical protein
VLNLALSGLPDHELRVSNILPKIDEDLRIALADTLWDVIMKEHPLLLLMVNLMHEGSMFEGTVFLKTIQELFGRKVHQNPHKKVYFKDLKIPLVVIASDIESGEMIVYSSRRHPDMEVAEAVRQSMSIPFVFEPRGDNKEIVDGGLCSNFPVWVYSSAGDAHWNPADIDHRRIKIGFSLDQTKNAPRTWNVQPPKFKVAGNPPHVDILEVLKPILIQKFVEFGQPAALAEVEVAVALFGASGLRSALGSGGELGLIKEILGVTQRGLLNTEESTRHVTVAALMNGLPYIDVPIPLLGYDGLDFYINDDEGPLMAMWDRAWRKTIEGLSDATTRGILPASVAITNTQTPFN